MILNTPQNSQWNTTRGASKQEIRTKELKDSYLLQKLLQAVIASEGMLLSTDDEGHTKMNIKINLHKNIEEMFHL